MSEKTELQIALLGFLGKPRVLSVILVMVLAPTVLLGIVIFSYGQSAIQALDEIRKNTTEMSLAIREICHHSIASARKNEP